MAVCDAVCSVECKELYGTILFDHLAAHGAGLTVGQVTVVTVGQVHTDLGSSLHLFGKQNKKWKQVAMLVSIWQAFVLHFCYVDGNIKIRKLC